MGHRIKMNSDEETVPCASIVIITSCNDMRNWCRRKRIAIACTCPREIPCLKEKVRCCLFESCYMYNTPWGYSVSFTVLFKFLKNNANHMTKKMHVLWQHVHVCGSLKGKGIENGRGCPPVQIKVTMSSDLRWCLWW